MVYPNLQADLMEKNVLKQLVNLNIVDLVNYMPIPQLKPELMRLSKRKGQSQLDSYKTQ